MDKDGYSQTITAMKRISLLLAALIHLPLAAQQATPAAPTAPNAANVTDSGAPMPYTEALSKILQEVQKMRRENRYTDALLKLDEAEKLAPNESIIYTMRSDVYLAPRRRDFDLAKEQFGKAMALDSKNPGPYFNLAELEFARHDFPKAAAAFRKFLADFPKLPFEVRHLAINRIVICEARQGHFDEAEKLIKDSFTFMDDTPAWQFSNAAIAFAKKDEKMAQEWLLRATSIFKENKTAAYFDALKEMRWIKDVDLEAVPVPGPAKQP